MLRHPELLAWEMLWTDSLRETYAAIYAKVKSIKPSIGVGWHIWHNNSFSPIYRAEQDLSELTKYSDFLKMVMYHNCGGERMASYIGSVGAHHLRRRPAAGAARLPLSRPGLQRREARSAISRRPACPRTMSTARRSAPERP